jgi:hypothetical protein
MHGSIETVGNGETQQKPVALCPKQHISDNDKEG